MNGSRSIKNNERNYPVKVSIRIRKEAEAPTVEEFEDEEICYECEFNPDPERERESSGYCPATCIECGACLGCDGSC